MSVQHLSGPQLRWHNYCQQQPQQLFSSAFAVSATARGALTALTPGMKGSCHAYAFPKNTYIYIYIYAVKLLSGPSVGFLNVIIWSKLGFFNVIIWSKFVFKPIKIVVSRDLVCTLSYHFVFFFVPNYLAII